jgi:hypothetical protein
MNQCLIDFQDGVKSEIDYINLLLSKIDWSKSKGNIVTLSQDLETINKQMLNLKKQAEK